MKLNLQKKFYARVIKNKRAKKRAIKGIETSSPSGDAEGKRVKLTTTADSKSDDKIMKNMVSRHAGILGLCAFVNAYPYDVPEFIPDILMFLSGYVHEVQPISVNIFCYICTCGVRPYHR